MQESFSTSNSDFFTFPQHTKHRIKRELSVKTILKTGRSVLRMESSSGQETRQPAETSPEVPLQGNNNDALVNKSGVSRQIKKTCESCVRSKVKCDGRKPCERCLKRGSECVFLFEQKRGRRPGPLYAKDDDVNETKVSSPKRVQLLSRAQTITETKIDPEPTINKGRNLIVTPSISMKPSTTFTNPDSIPSIFSANSKVNFPGSFFGGSNISQLPRLSQAPILSNNLLWMNINSNGFNASNPLNFPNFPSSQMIFPSISSANQANNLPSTYLSSIKLPPKTISIPFTVYERRMFRVLFTLYRHNSKCSLGKDSLFTWFGAKFGTLLTLCCQKRPLEDQQRFLSWLSLNNINVVRNISSICCRPRFPKVTGSQVQDRFLTSKLCTPESKLGTIKIHSSGHVECSNELQKWFGVNGEHFTFPVSSNESFFPWGADVLAEICAEDEDVLLYIREMSFTLSNQREIMSGLTKAQVVVPVSIALQNGFRINTNVLCEVTEVQTTEAYSYTVLMNFFVSPTEFKEGLSYHCTDLAPWHSNPSMCLETLLTWSDNQEL